MVEGEQSFLSQLLKKLADTIKIEQETGAQLLPRRRRFGDKYIKLALKTAEI